MNMQYIYSHNAEEATEQLVTTLKEKLDAGQKVLWLVSGGSGAKVSVDVAHALHETDLHNLSVTLSDERYGPVGHTDENWQQLLDDGFTLPGATTYRPLTGDDRDTTTQKFGTWLADTQNSTDYTLGLFGIGPDGHTAGVKPGSAAVDSSLVTASYTGEDFERITITPMFIATIDEAVTQAFGDDKHATMKQLLESDTALEAQPAQILKEVPKSTLYSDYKETK